MASLRKLRGRLLRWNRYDDRIVGGLDETRRVTVPPGHVRAERAVEAEIERRFWAETPEIWLGGPEGERALIADVLDWPPPTPEERRRADHLDSCWDGCDDLHDELCSHCEDLACLGDCQDDLQETYPGSGIFE